MKTSNSEQLLDTLAELQSRYPTWRFGQLIANVSDWANQNVWDIEDTDLLAAAEEHLETLSQHNEKTGT